MKKNTSTNIIIIIAVVITVIVAVCIYIVKKGIPNTTIVTEDINYDVKKTKSDIFYAEYNIGYNLFYVPDELESIITENGCIMPYSQEEWFAYTLENEENCVESLEKLVVDLSKESLIKKKISNTNDGFIGITPGGYVAGKFYTLNHTYYVMAYYIEDGSVCAYITTKRKNLSSGYKLVTENIKTMLYSDSVLEGTDDVEGNDGSIPASDPYITEILKGAKYSNMVVGKDFTRMKVIFSCVHPKNINEIYMRRQSDGSIIYPAEDEIHDEGDVIFLVDNVSRQEKFQFVVYTDSDIGEIKAYTVEYNASNAVKPDAKEE